MPTLNPRKLSPAAAALGLFFVVLAANVAMGQAVGSMGVSADWLLVATPLVLLGFTTAFVAWFRLDPKETLLLRLPTWPDLLMAIPFAISFVILSDQLSTLTSDLVPAELSEQLREVQLRWLRVSSPLEWVVKLATIGVGAAVSEELMFRGFIQSALSRSMRPASAVLWTSFLFMALHILPLPSFVAAGLVLGLAALASRSIAVPVLIHFLNNASALALVNLAGLETLGDPVWVPAEILLPAMAIFALSLVYCGGSMPERAPPSSPRASEGAILLGTSVLLLFFFSSLYMSNPQAAEAAILEALSQSVSGQLDPDAMDRAEEVDDAFRMLSTASESSPLGWRELWALVRVTAEAGADGTIDSNDVDTVVAARTQPGRATSPAFVLHRRKVEGAFQRAGTVDRGLR
jgi:membrane protease YdiL (CAAX protease family)